MGEVSGQMRNDKGKGIASTDQTLAYLNGIGMGVIADFKAYVFILIVLFFNKLCIDRWLQHCSDSSFVSVYFTG